MKGKSLTNSTATQISNEKRLLLKSYRKPSLSEYGDVRDFTLDGPTGNNDSGSGPGTLRP